MLGDDVEPPREVSPYQAMGRGNAALVTGIIAILLVVGGVVWGEINNRAVRKLLVARAQQDSSLVSANTSLLGRIDRLTTQHRTDSLALSATNSLVGKVNSRAGQALALAKSSSSTANQLASDIGRLQRNDLVQDSVMAQTPTLVAMYIQPKLDAYAARNDSVVTASRTNVGQTLAKHEEWMTAHDHKKPSTLSTLKTVFDLMTDGAAWSHILDHKGR